MSSEPVPKKRGGYRAGAGRPRTAPADARPTAVFVNKEERAVIGKVLAALRAGHRRFIIDLDPPKPQPTDRDA